MGKEAIEQAADRRSGWQGSGESMSYDLMCPYCEVGQDVCHDDGFGYEEDKRHEMECSSCGKNFVFTTSIVYYYEPYKADCLNGEPHDMEPVQSYPRCWPDWKRCKNCDHEVRGDYVEPERGAV